MEEIIIKDNKKSEIDKFNSKIENAKRMDKLRAGKKYIIFITFQIMTIISFLLMLTIGTTYATGDLTGETNPAAPFIVLSFVVPVLTGIIFALLSYITRIWNWKGFKEYGNKMVLEDKITSEMLQKWELEAQEYQEVKYTNREIKRLKSLNDRNKLISKQRQDLEKQIEKEI